MEALNVEKETVAWKANAITLARGQSLGHVTWKNAQQKQNGQIGNHCRHALSRVGEDSKQPDGHVLTASLALQKAAQLVNL